jgi:hypothetical protein|tara:strand:- start:2544 stop:2684 length:141 start_codon:yes stop_codon:yes gene_type:complete
MGVTKPGNMRFLGLSTTGGAGISSIFPSNTQQKAAAVDLSILAEAR